MTSAEWDEQFHPIIENESYKDFHPKVVNKEEKKQLELAILENRVWTLIENDFNSLILIEGLHLVNRIDVYITELPYNTKETYEITWED